MKDLTWKDKHLDPEWIVIDGVMRFLSQNNYTGSHATIAGEIINAFKDKIIKQNDTKGN